MDIKRAMPDINKHIKKETACIMPSANAHLGLNVPEIVFKYGSIRTKVKSIPRLWRYMLGCIKEIKKSYRALYIQPDKASAEISAKDLADLMTLVKDMGIDDIGFAKVDQSYIFSDKKILYKNAMVLLMEMNPEIIKTVPSKAGEKEIFRTYYRLNVAVNVIKNFLNERGYNGQAGPALGGEVNYPLLAQKAGMGALGKHGLLITPSYGPSIRLAAVYTDIKNLPMSDKNEHAWVTEFCDKCNRCVKKCPVQAIYKNSVVFEDKSKQCIDYKKCAVPFSKDHGCTICIKECVFFKSDYEKIKKGYEL